MSEGGHSGQAASSGAMENNAVKCAPSTDRCCRWRHSDVAGDTPSTRTSLATGVLYWPQDISPSISVATLGLAPLLLHVAVPVTR